MPGILVSTAEGQEHDKIRKELRKFSWITIREFEEILPSSYPSDKLYAVEIFPKEYRDEEDYSIEYIFMFSPEDFWNRWNRFKKLRAFL